MAFLRLDFLIAISEKASLLLKIVFFLMDENVFVFVKRVLPSENTSNFFFFILSENFQRSISPKTIS